MKALWTWSGKSFGYREANDLWTYGGQHIGRFCGEEVYGADGHYMGELRKGRQKELNRLIVDTSKNNLRNDPFIPNENRDPSLPLPEKSGLIDRTGYRDFPGAEFFGLASRLARKSSNDRKLCL